MPDADRRPGIHARENPAGGPASAPLTPKAPVLECLHEIKDSAEAIDRAALLDLSQSQNVPLADVQSSFSFYPRFSESVPPESIGICDGPACRMAGGPSLSGKIQAAGRPTHTVPCQGRCADAPAAVMGRSPGRIGGDGPAPAFVASIEEGRPQSLPEYEKEGGYAILRFVQGTGEVKRIIDALKESGLAGMGGAGFPTGQKWEIVRQVRGPVKYVVANADEGEPGTFKDRWILERFPHTFLEGLLVAMRVIGAEKGFIYLRDEYWDALSPLLQRAIEEARHARHFGVDASRHARQVGVELRRGAGCYVCGEETALLESIEGKRGEPRLRPPYPGQAGLWGAPTLINNVETLYYIPEVLRRGSLWYRGPGVGEFFGRRHVSLSGAVRNPGVYEVMLGTPFSEIIEKLGGGMRDGGKLKAIIPGGLSSGYLPASRLDTPYAAASLKAEGTFAGSGAVVVVPDSVCMVDLTLAAARFFAEESCGKCTPCRIGTSKIVQILESARAGRSGAGAVPLLVDLAEAMETASICGLGQSAPLPIQSLLAHFREEFDAHLAGRCPAGICIPGG